MARLILGGKDHGPHAFVVQLRDSETHQPLRGVTLGDIGPKMVRPEPSSSVRDARACARCDEMWHAHRGSMLWTTASCGLTWCGFLAATC